MQFDLDEFCADLIRIQTGALRQKYNGKIPSDLTIDKVCKCMERLNLIEEAIGEWYEGQVNVDGLYFINVNNGYEVFTGERGFKHILRSFKDVRKAVIWWLDLMLNDIGYSAPDSEIGK